MKNSISISLLALLVSSYNFSAFAETHAAPPKSDDFKVQLKPDTRSKKTAQVEHSVAHDEHATAKKPAPAKSKKTNSIAYVRDIQTVNGKTVYTVNARAPHLYMVSRDLYGNANQWKAIADWNEIKAPFNLRQGQELVLKREPTISTSEADTLLMSTWAGMNRQDIVDGIAGSQPAAVVKTEKPAPIPVPVMAVETTPHPELPTPAPATTAAPSEVDEQEAAKVAESKQEEPAEKKETVKEEPAKEDSHT